MQLRKKYQSIAKQMLLTDVFFDTYYVMKKCDCNNEVYISVKYILINCKK